MTKTCIFLFAFLTWISMDLFPQSRSGDGAGVVGNLVQGTAHIQADDAVEIGVTVIEKSLVGVGKMILNLREPNRFREDLADVPKTAVNFDTRTGRFVLTAGGEALMEVDGNTGEYRLQSQDAGAIAGTLIETSLAGIGAMIGSLRPGHHMSVPPGTRWAPHPLDMSEASLDALLEVWKRETGSDQGSLAMLGNLNAILQFEQGQRRFREGMAQLEAGMNRLDRAMKRLDRAMKKLEQK